MRPWAAVRTARPPGEEDDLEGCARLRVWTHRHTHTHPLIKSIYSSKKLTSTWLSIFLCIFRCYKWWWGRSSSALMENLQMKITNPSRLINQKWFKQPCDHNFRAIPFLTMRMCFPFFEACFIHYYSCGCSHAAIFPPQDEEITSPRHDKTFTDSSLNVGVKVTDCRIKVCPCSLGWHTVTNLSLALSAGWRNGLLKGCTHKDK